MIFISSSCSKKQTIKGSIEEILQHGFSNIELSGGTQYYPDLEEDIQDLQQKLNVNFLLHNYFPPPKKDFILNLASLNDDIFNQTIAHCKRAIDLSIKLGCEKYAVHAGFFVDIKLNEIGKKLSKDKLFDIQQATDRFCNTFLDLVDYTKGKVTLYLENNVISDANYRTFNQVNPFLLTDYQSYIELKELIEFDILLDVGHLKVSCHTLRRSLDEDLGHLINCTDYIHISDNNGSQDENKGLLNGAPLLSSLNKYDLSGKLLTLEIYESFETIRNSYENIQTIIDGKRSNL